MMDKAYEKDIIKRVLDGETDAFQEVIDNNIRLVNHIIYRMVKDETEREDLVQDVFMKVYSKLNSFKFDAKLSTWIAQIAYHRTLNHLEKKKVELFDDLDSEQRGIDSLDGKVLSPEDFAVSNDRKAKLKKEIDQLPNKYKTVITLFHLEDMTYEEIGKIMKLPDGTVKSHLFRARKLLKERLLKRYSVEDICQFGT